MLGEIKIPRTDRIRTKPNYLTKNKIMNSHLIIILHVIYNFNKSDVKGKDKSRLIGFFEFCE